MSEFLPSDFKGNNQLVAGSSTAENKTQPPVTDADRELAKRILRPELFSEALLAYLSDYTALNSLPIPLSMIQGYPLTLPYHAEVTTSETTTSTSYTDLATTGPHVKAAAPASGTPSGTGLADGVYLILFGFTGFCNNNNHSAYMSINVNSGGAADADACLTEGDGSSHSVSVSRGLIKTLRNSNDNDVKAMFRTTAGTSTFESRWLIAQRLAAA